MFTRYRMESMLLSSTPKQSNAIIQRLYRVTATTSIQIEPMGRIPNRARWTGSSHAIHVRKSKRPTENQSKHHSCVDARSHPKHYSIYTRYHTAHEKSIFHPLPTGTPGPRTIAHAAFPSAAACQLSSPCNPFFAPSSKINT